MMAPLLVMQNAPSIDPQALARSFLHIQHAGSTSQVQEDREDVVPLAGAFVLCARSARVCACIVLAHEH